MRTLGTILLTLIVTLGFSQVDPEQIYQAPGRDYVLLSTDTLNSSYPINGIYVPTRLKDSIFFKADSVCISIFDDGRPEKCLLMPEGGGGSSDTLSYWIFQVNGGVDDTIYQAERINLVAGTRITITGGTDNPTINADSCLQRLEQLTDSTFQITDCAGSPLDTILIPIPGGGGGGTDDQEITQFEISNDTIYLTLEDGGGQKFLVVEHPDTCFHSAEAVTDSSFQILDCNGVPLDTVTLRFDGENDLNWAYDNLTFSGNRTHTLGGFDLRVDGPGDVRWIDVTDYVIDADAAVTVNGDDAVSITSLFGDIQSFSVGGDNRMIAADTIKLNSTAGLYEFGTGTSAFNLPPINDTLQYAIAVDTNTGRWYLRDVSTAETAPDSLEYRGDSIAIIGSNALRIFDLIDTTGWGVDIDTDSQSLSIVDHTLSITRGNSVVLPDTVAPSQTLSIDADTITLSDGGGSVVIQHPPSSDTVKLKPFHEVWTNSDSTLTVNAGFDTLVTYNDSIRWKLLDNRIDAIALGKGARSDHYNSTALGARAFPYLQDTLVYAFNSTQVDTASEWIDGLGSFISHLNDLGYQTGDIVVIKWSLTSGEMPFIDTAQDLRVAEGIHAFTITSPSLLSPVQFGFDSVPTGAYTLQANQYLTGSTAIGHDAVVDKANQIALGDSTSQELKLGDSIRMKIDTAYTHFQLVGFDSTYNQLIPIDAAAFGFTPDADFWELEVDASPGSITDNTYTLGQTVFAADTSVNSYYVQVVPPNGDGINVRDPFSDDVDIMWSGTTYSWAWRLENDAFFLQDAGDPGVGTGVYISAINGYDGGAAILELQADGGMQWSNYGIGSPRDGGSDFYAIPFVDGGGGVYQLRPDDFLDSLDLSDVGDSSGVVIPTGEIYFGQNTRAADSGPELTWDGSSALIIDNGGEGTYYAQMQDVNATTLRIDKVSSSTAIIDLNADPTSGTDGAVVRINRYANTTGASYLDVLYGNNTAAAGARIQGNTGNSWIGRYGNVAIGHNAPSAQLHVDGDVLIETSTTEDVQIEIDGTVRAHWEGSNGYLGINTTSPARRFHVNGAQRFTNLGSVDAISYLVYMDSDRDVGEISVNDFISGAGGPWAASSAIYWELLSGQVITKSNRPVRINSGLADYAAVTDPGSEYAVLAYFDNAGNDEVRWKTITGSGIASITGSGGTINVQAIEVDGSTSNELQTLSWNSGSNQLTISSGNTVDLSSLAGGGGGDGIYGGSDNLTAGTTTATIPSGSVFNFQYNTGDSEFTISGTGTFLRSNPSGASNAVELDAVGVSIEAASGDQIDFNVAGGTNEIVIDGSNVYVNDGMLIGGATDDQIRIGGTSGQYAYVGHEDAGGISGNGIRFYDNGTNNMEIEIDGETYIGDTNTERLKIHNTSTTVLMGHETGDDSAIRFYANGNLAFAVPANNIQMLGDYVWTDDTELGVGDVPNTLSGYELDVDGDINYSGSLTNVSDSTIKKDITYLTDPYEKVLALKPAMFHYKDGIEETEPLNKERWHYNYIAQDYQQVFPDQITMDYDIMAIQKGAAEMYTVAAVQQLIKDVQQLKSEIETLKKK